MECPVCNNVMITLELQQVEVDFCPDCGGIWLDAGELEMLLGEHEKTEQLLSSFRVDKDNPEKLHKCPICLKKMEKVVVGDCDAPVLIDRCIRKHGLWFDKGELVEVVQKAQIDDNDKVKNLLKEVFNIHK